MHASSPIWRMSFASAVVSCYLKAILKLSVLYPTCDLVEGFARHVLLVHVSPAPRDTDTFQLFTTKLSGWRNRPEIVACVCLFRTVGDSRKTASFPFEVLECFSVCGQLSELVVRSRQQG